MARSLDIYPAIPRTSAAPVVVFFQGGGWEDGSKVMHQSLGRMLEAQGFTVVVPDYRVFPEVAIQPFWRTLH